MTFRDIEDSPDYDNIDYWSSSFPTGSAELQGTGGSVAQQVLNAFDIPYSGEGGSDLPGMDIKSMQASQALNISLGAELKDQVLREAYMNGAGIVEFVEVGGSSPANIEELFGVSTSSLKTPIDLVIVTGYDPPIRRWLGAEVDYLKNKEIYGPPDQVKDAVCHGGTLDKVAYISFEDGVLSSDYGQTVGANSIGKFDNHIGFIYKVNNPGGSEVSWSISKNETREFIRLNASSVAGAFAEYDGAPAGGAGCWYKTSVACSTTMQLGPFKKDDPEWGVKVNDFSNIARIFFIGRAVNSASFLYPETTPTLNAKYEAEVIELDSSKDFAVEYNVLTGYVELCFKRVKHISTSWLYRYSGSTPARVSFFNEAGTYMGTAGSFAGASIIGGKPADINAGEWIVDFANRKIGWLVYDMYVEVIRNRPSITFNDEAGTALTRAAQLSIKAIPIFTTDEPPPIATNEGIVDQESGRIDNDPTTIQSFTETPEFRMEELRQGNVIEISLPYLDATEAYELAVYLKGLYDSGLNVPITNYTCSPKSEPNLGDAYKGGIVNNIEYSYQDSSAYQITVTTGPKMEKNVGFSSSIFQLQTETVNTTGVVTQAAGNGVNYTVKTVRFGALPAYNGVAEDFEVGDVVNLTIHNHPQVSFGGRS